MISKKYFLLLFLLNFYFSKAQVTPHTTVFVGYEYQNQSFGEVGTRFIFLKKDDVLYRLSGSALFGSANRKLLVLPKIQGDFLLNFNKNTTLQHGNYFLIGAEATTVYVAPKIGISILGILDFTGGYAFNYGDKRVNEKKLEGLNFNFSINIPLVVFQK